MLSEINGSRVDFGDDSSAYGVVLGFGRVWVWLWSWLCGFGLGRVEWF